MGGAGVGVLCGGSVGGGGVGAGGMGVGRGWVGGGKVGVEVSLHLCCMTIDSILGVRAYSRPSNNDRVSAGLTGVPTARLR